MLWRAAMLSAAVGLFPAGAFASCGSDQCPIDIGHLWRSSRLTLDVSHQYLDQDHPRIGTQDAAIGAIPGEEDEVRTLSRITTARASYRLAEAWSLTASVPYVSRYHEHIHNESGTPELQRWSYTGFGDLEGWVIRAFPAGASSARRFHLSAGFKAPTGKRHVEEIDGHEPEPPARPGQGAWGAIAGAGMEWSLSAKAPLRLSLLGRANGRGTERYRVGSELQANLGLGYPVRGAIEVLFSGDLRVRAKDDVGDSDAEAGHTGGTWAYLSPGLRLTAGKNSFYGVVQLPVYQRVNGINLVSDYNLYLGVTRAAL